MKHPSAYLFQGLLKVSGFFARRPRFNALTRQLMRRFADLTLWQKRAKPQVTIEGLGSEWQRMFPSRKFVPIEAVEGDTLYANICGACPVKATGDVNACFRMMEYDRRLLEVIGGEFVVLESQADPQTNQCRVAMRLKGTPTDDLTPAHKKPLKPSA